MGMKRAKADSRVGERGTLNAPGSNFIRAGNGWRNELRLTHAWVMTTRTTPIQALQRFYEAEGRYSATGLAVDRCALLSTLHPEIILYQPPSLPYGGQWRGREGFGKWLDAFVQTWTDITPTDPVFHACGDEVLVSTVNMRARARSTGNEIVMPMCQLIRIADDLPIEWRNFAWDTVLMVDALE